MTRKQIQTLALQCGFRCGLRPDGKADLSPRVYRFAEKLLQQDREEQAFIRLAVNDRLKEQEQDAKLAKLKTEIERLKQ